MTTPADMAHCAEAIRHGSRSFHAASGLLPRRLREPALALYAFCRLADDEVDLTPDGKARAVAGLRARLDLCYAGTPRNAPEDRAFSDIIQGFGMPRALPEALLEGLAWDASGRRYATLPELRAYAARVASAVGAMMCVLMRVRDPHALARACDLGVAMQLTNIARDVGEDAREGRLYLPLDWLETTGLDPAAFLAQPAMSPELGALVQRLLREADALYIRAEAGIRALPLDCRPGIFAARYIYAGIGTQLRRAHCDPVSQRARTTGAQKLGWLMQAGLRAGLASVMPRSPVIYARPLPETVFLVEAAADRAARGPAPGDVLFSALAQMKARDAAEHAALVGRAGRASSAA
ncbi:15-cis-phytoene synthase [Salipiger mucosus]|uniref:Phytoene synthase n=1 Tax=Salipiger mucosus DSM 16094 TaxID=1123237 RepID=S9Q3X0_9RHOB|nr:phytoene/squalene synthase family protein [Salipiger mucosus]EPX76016.1 Phytoene synthase [Salipiger mucosus DSM 16094]